jgi:hypothetical protein
MNFSQRPYMTQDKSIRSSLTYAFLASTLIIAGLYWDFEPLTGIAIGGLIIALLFGLIFWAQRRHLRRILDPMVEGNRFVHWIYSPNEWQGHMGGENKRVPRHLRRYLFLGIGLGSIMAFLIFAAEFWLEKRGLYISLKYGAIGFIPLLVLCLIIGLFEELFRARRLRELGQLGGEVYIGRDGLYYSGALYLRAFYRTLKWRDTSGKAGLLFHFEIPVRHGHTRTEEILIPTPAGQEQEAKRLFEQVQAAW